MISAGDFKNGITLEIDGNVCQIVEFQHVKPGKGAAFVRTKYKNIITGSVVEKSFRPTEKFPAARIGEVFAIEPPLFVELEVIETEPGFAGNTAQGATKPATVETGAQVQVPLFVNQGDKLKIDTRTGEYLSRV